ncbi:type II secretion system minor pseudopilin GspH [Vibrio sp. M260118]|uniref:type II secretion system minor pseudopilin GspH n=1 Tax=Vibrio sp. M260118 TaxID=3020896 RepID=UPI002F4133EE
MRRQCGFTLLEVLLVLVLVSVASVAVIATLPVNAEDGAKKQAQSLFHRMQLLNEEAMLSGNDFGLRVDEKASTYHFMRLQTDGWQQLEQSPIPAQTKLDDNLSIMLTLGGDAWNNKDRLFQPGSLFDEEMFAELEDKQKQRPPQVFVMSSGEVTPFSIAIYPQDGSADEDAWQVVAKENGQILLLAPGERDEES